MPRAAERVAVDVRAIHASGIGTYIRNLVPRLIERGHGVEWTLVGDPAALADHAWSRGARVRVAPCDAGFYSPGEHWKVAAAAARHGATLLWAPHYNTPLLWRGRLVATVHDVAHLAVPELLRGARRRYAAALLAAVRRRARAILFDSDFSRREFERLVGAPRGDSRVVHLGVDRGWFEVPSAPSPHRGPYVLYVGNVKPHKNLGRLVSAFARIAGEVPHDLVIVGQERGLVTPDPAVRDAAAALGARVVLTGQVSHDALAQYVAHAAALAHPSLYEGFGLPPLEAMAAGCPALVARAASLPEVCGDAALYCDPRDPADIAAQLRRLLSDDALRADLRTRGRVQAASFSWDACADRTAAVLAGATR